MQYYEATGDNRAFDVLMKYFKYIHETKPDWPHENMERRKGYGEFCYRILAFTDRPEKNGSLRQ